MPYSTYSTRTVTIDQPLFTTRLANWHLSLPTKSNLEFLKGVWQWKLSFCTKWWKASGNRVRNVIKNGVGDFKVLYRQDGKWFKRTSTENTLDLLLYKTECISRTEHTCSSNTGERSLPFTYRNLGKSRCFYSLNGKSHKKSFSGWAHRWPFL